MMNNSILHRSASVLLSLILTMQTLPVNSFAQETTVTVPWGENRTEVTLGETERVTTYQFEDLKTTVGDVTTYGLQNHCDSREVISLNDLDWKFSEGSGSSFLSDADAIGSDVDDSTWESVNLPHTWNAEDTQDGIISNMSKTLSWYRGILNMESIAENKHYYLEFKGANQITRVYVNGTKIPLALNVVDYSTNNNILSVDIGEDYAHMGGYTAFRYDLTSYLNHGENLIAISVDNRVTQEVAPIFADFNFYGGIYRDLNLVIVDDVHIAMDDYGSSGLYVATPNAGKQATNVTEQPANLGQLDIRAQIQNDSAAEKTVTVNVSVMDESGIRVVTAEAQTLTIPANSGSEYSKTVTVDNPILWEGIDYSEGADNANAGYQYTVLLEVKNGTIVIDSVQEKVGFRWFYVDADTGFYLNGESYPLRGVCRHQDRQGKGNAVSYEDHLEDITMIMEMGVNTIRLSHYPQDSYVYDLCDANGLVVWAEIPLIDYLGLNTIYDETTKSMLVEMIRQQYNHPSICFWGLQNELRNNLYDGGDYTVLEIMAQLDALSKTEDPSRYTTQASCIAQAFTEGWTSDLVAMNIYPGWYNAPGFENAVNNFYNMEVANKDRPVGISEYGTGAGINTTIHELNPEPGSIKANSYWQPEEYQNIQHEEALEYLLSESGDKIWGSFLWNMFDFGVDHRAQEAGEWEKNNKGLVSYDRTIRKDAFYLYKAQLNNQDPFVYITSRRYESRVEAPSYIKVYSNCDQVWLSISKNGGEAQIIEMTKNADLNAFTVEDQMGEVGEYIVEVYGIRDSDTDTVYTDSVTWTRAASSSTDLVSADNAVLVNNDNAQITIVNAMTMEQFCAILTGAEQATYKVYSGTEEITDAAAIVRAGMTLAVTSEDGSATKTYSVVPPSLSAYAEVSASSNESSNVSQNAIDGDSSTRWAASSSAMPQHFIADLKDTYCLTDVSIDWYNGNNADRTWTYNVYVSQDNTTWEEVIVGRIVTCAGVDHVVDTVDLGQRCARFVKIEVTGSNFSTAFASFYEIEVYGWKLEIDENPDFTFTIDQDRYLIVCDKPITSVSYADFGNAISIKGNGSAALNSVGPNTLNEGDSVTVTDHNGRKYTYPIVTEGSTETTAPINIALHKNVSFSTEEGVSGDGNFSNTCAYSVNDGDKTTRWAAEVAKHYPEWITIDLGKPYEIGQIDALFFNNNGNRAYYFDIMSSLDGEIFTTFITNSEDNTTGDFSYSIEAKTIPSGTVARYIKVNVTGSNDQKTNQYTKPSIYEIEIYAAKEDSAGDESCSHDEVEKVYPTEFSNTRENSELEVSTKCSECGTVLSESTSKANISQAFNVYKTETDADGNYVLEDGVEISSLLKPVPARVNANGVFPLGHWNKNKGEYVTFYINSTVEETVALYVEFSCITGATSDKFSDGMDLTVNGKKYTSDANTSVGTTYTPSNKYTFISCVDLAQGNNSITLTMNTTDGNTVRNIYGIKFAAEDAVLTAGIIPETISTVIELIDAIGTVTANSGNAIVAARNAYDALAVNQKAKVSNYETLVQAEKKYAALSKVVAWNLTLGDDIGLKFLVSVNEVNAEYTYVNITVGDGEPVSYKVSELTPDEDGYYLFSANVAAAQMTEKITLDFVQNGVSVLQRSYAVRDYAVTILDGNYHDRTKNLVTWMLNYGAAAQQYFGIDTDNLGNAGYELTDAAVLPSEYEAMATTGSIEGIKFYGASLVFESMIAVRYYFQTDSVEGVSFTAGGTEYEAFAKNGMYYVEVPGINPQDYDKSIVLSVTKGKESLAVSYSPLNYIIRMSSKGSDSLKSLVNALYGYHDAAVRYATEKNFFGETDGYITTSNVNLNSDTGDNTGIVTVSENGLAYGYIDSFSEDSFYFETKVHVNSILPTENYPKFGLIVEYGNIQENFYVDMKTALTATVVGRVTSTDGLYDWDNDTSTTVQGMAFSGEGETITLGILKDSTDLHFFVDGNYVLTHESTFEGSAVAGFFGFNTNMTITEYFTDLTQETKDAKLALIAA